MALPLIQTGGGGSSGPTLISGKGGMWAEWIMAPMSIIANVGNISAQNVIRCRLFTLPYPVTVTGLAIQISGTAQAGTVVDVALYDINGKGVFNSNGAAFGGTGFDGTSTGVKSKTFTMVTIPAGQYYWAWTGKSTGTLASVSWLVATGNLNGMYPIANTINGWSFISSDLATNGILPSSLTIANLSTSGGFDPPACWWGF